MPICPRHGAHYVNFFHPRASDPFSREWQRYFASDRLHPSNDCYRYVYEALVKSTPTDLVKVADDPPAEPPPPASGPRRPR